MTLDEFLTKADECNYNFNCSSAITQFDVDMAYSFVSSRIGYECGCFECAVVFYVYALKELSPELDNSMAEKKTIDYMFSKGLINYGKY